MGSTEFYEEEGPVHEAAVKTFWIDRYDVTNAEFARFVAATHYVTDAERKPNPADYPEVAPDKLVAGGAVFSPPGGVRSLEDPLQWWSFVPGADWRHPEGPSSGIEGRDDYPVVQVSYNDAAAYAKWAGRELPTEEQFEYAARGGLDGKAYGWGDELNPGGKQMANTWRAISPTATRKPMASRAWRQSATFWPWLRALRHHRQCLGIVRRAFTSAAASQPDRSEDATGPKFAPPRADLFFAPPIIAAAIAPPRASLRKRASALRI